MHSDWRDVPEWNTEVEDEVRRYARSTAKDCGICNQDFEDCEQYAILAVLKNWNKPATTNRKAFLMRCARNAVVDVARQNQRKKYGEWLPLLDHGGVEWNSEHKINEASDVALSIHELDEIEQLVVRLRIEGEWHRDIRERLNVTDDLYRSIVRSVRRKIANHLLIEFFDDDGEDHEELEKEQDDEYR